MKFIDLNLRSADKAAMNAALRAAGFTCTEKADSWHHSEASLLLLDGMITRQTGEVRIVDGVEIAVREPVPSYHANVRTTSEDLAAALAPVTVIADAPQYVWA